MVRLSAVLIVLVFLLAGCKKENTPVVAIETPIGMINTVTKAKGQFSDGPYGSVTGQARIYEEAGSLKVELDSFSASNGPDLKVYLSLELNPSTFVNIGSLKSTMGKQVYTCPAGTDAARYKYVLIYCQQYSHLFGHAEFK